MRRELIVPRPVRILMINYEFPPLGGGSGNATFHLLRELSAEGSLDIHVVTSGRRGWDEPAVGFDGVRIERIPIAKRATHFWTTREMVDWSLRAFRRVGTICAGRAFDVCHAWGGWPSGVIAHRHRQRTPYLVALRGSDVPGYNPRLRRLDPYVLAPLSRRVWRRAAAVTCVSDDLARLARRTAPDVSYTVIRNGVDTTRFAPEPDHASSREGNSAPLRVLYLGRLIERKSVRDLLVALGGLEPGLHHVCVDVVGSGPEHAALERLAHGSGLGDRVHFHGAAEADDVPRHLRRADVFVMPSIEEAMSNAALEAMATGLPIITTKTGVAEVIDGNGVIVDPGRPDQIRDAILRYVKDPDLVRAHGRRSRVVSETLSWRRVAESYLELYATIGSDPRAAGGAR